MSGSHLSHVGTQQYAVDLVNNINSLKKAIAPGSFVAHGPLLFSCGLGDMGTIRAVSDICHWQSVLEKDGAAGDFLPVSNKAVVSLIERRGTVGAQPLYPLRMALPANMASPKCKQWSC